MRWADQIIAQLQARLGDEVPVTWDVRITPRDALAVNDALMRTGKSIRLGDLLRDPTDRDRMLAACALICVRANETMVLPAEDADVTVGDECLFRRHCASACVAGTDAPQRERPRVCPRRSRGAG